MKKIIRRFFTNTLFGRQKKYTGIIRPDRYDGRDFIKDVPETPKALAKQTFSLRRNIDYIHDQGTVGSCTGHSTAQAIYILSKRGFPGFHTQLSPMYIYWFARKYLGMDPTKRDDGAYLRDAFKTAHKQGTISNRHTRNWADPYSEPPTNVQKYFINSYFRVLPSQDNFVEDIKKILYIEKLPIVISVRLHQNVLNSAARGNGVLNKALPGDPVVGYHAITLTGFTENSFEFINSWGRVWGDGGYGYIPFDNIDIIYDLWTFDLKYW